MASASKENFASETGCDGDDMASFLKSKRTKTGDDELLTTRTGGAYIPPARLRLMQVYLSF